MDGVLTINGAQIDRRYLIVGIAWDIVVLFYVPIVVIGTRRAFLAYRRSDGELKDLLVYWVHIAVIALILAIVAIDAAAIFWDRSGLLNLIILIELTVLNYSSVIYTFVTSMQHYIVQSTLQVPPWVYTFKKVFLIFNFVVGNILLVVQVVVDRVWISGLTLLFLATEGCLIAPLFIRLVLTLTKRLTEQYSSKSSEESPDTESRSRITKAIKKLKAFTFTTCFLIYFFALIVYGTYIPRLGVPADILHSDSAEYPDFARTRRFKATFKLNWIMWVSVSTSSYFLWRHWIKKSSFAGKLTVNSTDKLSKNTTSRDDDGSYTDTGERRTSTGAQSVASHRSFGSPRRSSDAGLTYSQKRTSVHQGSSPWATPRRVSVEPQQQQQSPRRVSVEPRHQKQEPVRTHKGFTPTPPATRRAPRESTTSATGFSMSTQTPTSTRLSLSRHEESLGYSSSSTPMSTRLAPMTNVVVEASTRKSSVPRATTTQARRDEGGEGIIARQIPPPARSLPSRPDLFSATSA